MPHSGDFGYGSRLCENLIRFGPNAVGTTNFCVYSFSVRLHTSKIMVRFYRTELSHSLGPHRTYGSSYSPCSLS
jgi:hypothetical protein